MTTGERIKNLRERLGISQVEFAEKINVSKQTLYKYENNLIVNIPSDKIEAAARIANVSPAYIMGWDNETRPSQIMSGTDIRFDFWLKANDNSMNGARIHKGDTVFIRRQSSVKNGEIAAVTLGSNNVVQLRRLFYYQDRSMLILRAENPAFEDLIFQNEEQNDVQILGKAVAFQSDIL